MPCMPDDLSSVFGTHTKVGEKQFHKLCPDIYRSTGTPQIHTAINRNKESIMGKDLYIPKTRVSRWPLELVLLAKVHSEVVATCEAFVTDMTFVPWL